jgi:hypothetical protein
MGQIVLIDGIEPQKGSFNRAELKFVMDNIPLMQDACPPQAESNLKYRILDSYCQ